MSQNNDGQPDQLAKWVGMAIVGGVAAFVVGKAIKATTGPAGAVFGAIITILVHEMLGAPVSRAVGELGL